MQSEDKKQAGVMCTPAVALTDLPALGMDAASLREDFRLYFNHTLGRDKHCQSNHYKYEALALTLRSRLLERWNATRDLYREKGFKRTYYLSLEFLMGRALGNAMINLGVKDSIEQAMMELCVQLEVIAEEEHDAGLGNGGLGRLAACFLDSCATLQLPVMGYGIRYEYGMFKQRIANGEQIEEPDHWLRDGNPWEMERPEFTQRVCFGGRTEFYRSDDGQQRARWVDTSHVLAVPYDLPIPGYKNDTVNTLRLWSATSTDIFDLREFNAGSYPESVAAKNEAENITMVLYPNDSSENGKELRLKQQYFLASATLQDVFRRWEVTNQNDFSSFAANNCFQMNDTHPTLAVVELMRLLLDEQRMGWDEAWAVTTQTMAYTNHTLLPEALEKWPVRLFEDLLPRLLEIIYEINARFISVVAQRWPGDIERQKRMSIIEEGHERSIRMAYLGIVGSFSVNGVAALHTQLLTAGLFSDFNELWPEKFSNKTNGVTPRRWLVWANPTLSNLISDKIGEEWITDLSQLSKLHEFKKDAAFKIAWKEAKQKTKQKLAALIEKDCGILVNTNMMFDVQVKRIHEYKRQLLNVLHIIYLYDKIKRNELEGTVPRCVIIGGKAAPGYRFAKNVIKLI
ncbi:MAG: glycogen/starch/alpha-glucan family phosphorylase, partial [Gammaproteobacteria bacterium]|nr:glycogen/starch/alpha-glucan family phosphorylase [Gammaproteobacteria bacterium]